MNVGHLAGPCLQTFRRRTAQRRPPGCGIRRRVAKARADQYSFSDRGHTARGGRGGRPDATAPRPVPGQAVPTRMPSARTFRAEQAPRRQRAHSAGTARCSGGWTGHRPAAIAGRPVPGRRPLRHNQDGVGRVGRHWALRFSGPRSRAGPSIRMSLCGVPASSGTVHRGPPIRALSVPADVVLALSGPGGQPGGIGRVIQQRGEVASAGPGIGPRSSPTRGRGR